MNTHIPQMPRLIVMAAITGLMAMAPNLTQAQTADDLDQSVFPMITAQPVDQAVPAGSNAVLSVQAANADTFQWQTNGVDIAGQTNSTLAIQNVGIKNAGLYSCNVSESGGDAVPTRAASLNVVVAVAGVYPGQPIVVFGGPKVSNGMQGTCPGRYAGYVNYTKTISQGWGWTPTNGATLFTAADGSGRTDTIIMYGGMYGDTGCNPTSVTIPNPPFSPAYRFTIFFPNNVPTTNYPIVLTGFNP